MSTDVMGDMDVLKKIYEEMKKMQKEQEEMKVLMKAGLHGVWRELRFLQEVIDEDWKEKSDIETEMESNVEEVDRYKEEGELRTEKEAAKQLSWEVQDVRDMLLGKWLKSEADSPGSEGNMDMQ